MRMGLTRMAPGAEERLTDAWDDAQCLIAHCPIAHCPIAHCPNDRLLAETPTPNP